MNRPRFFSSLGILLLAGCVVPLKTPPIQGPVQQPTIDFGRLAEFAAAAGHAYDLTPAIEAAYGKKNVVVRDLPKTDGRYFIYFDHANRVQTISVRGTSNKANAWSDLNAVKVPDLRLGIFLHLGFKTAAADVYADAVPFLQKDYKTRVTGHSLGGAVACILMMDLLDDGYQIDQVLTFGQPKVTNEAGGKKFANAPYFRIINDQDIVAQVPPSNIVYDLSGPYLHFGPEITLFADKKYTYSPVNTPRDLITGDNWKNINPDDVADHQIKNYIDRLQALK